MNRLVTVSFIQTKISLTWNCPCHHDHWHCIIYFNMIGQLWVDWRDWECDESLSSLWTHSIIRVLWVCKFIWCNTNSIIRVLWVCKFIWCTTVACKRSQSFCQKCMGQVTTKHACTRCMWLCHMVCGYTVYAEWAEMTAVSCGIRQHCSKYTTSVDRFCVALCPQRRDGLQWIFKNVL